jgi:hypothetical protein
MKNCFGVIVLALGLIGCSEPEPTFAGEEAYIYEDVLRVTEATLDRQIVLSLQAMRADFKKFVYQEHHVNIDTLDVDSYSAVPEGVKQVVAGTAQLTGHGVLCDIMTTRMLLDRAPGIALVEAAMKAQMVCLNVQNQMESKHSLVMTLPVQTRPFLFERGAFSLIVAKKPSSCILTTTYGNRYIN